MRATFYRLLSVFLLLSVLLAGQGVKPAYAATYTVTKTADTNDGTCDSDCSLREAISAANANAGADTVTIPAGTYQLTLTGFDNTNAGGDLDINESLTITGAGAGSTIIQQTVNTERVIHIVANYTVSISGVRITGGAEGNGQGGGGIYNNGALTINDSEITNNTTTADGGGIYNANASLTVNNVTISSNSANFGGGIYNNNASTATITNTVISANSTTGGGGGALNGGTMNITNSLLSNNTSGFSAGGILNGGGGTLNITRSTFYNNTASNTGGGIRNDNPGTVTITNSTFALNSATFNGGGVHNASTLNVNNSTFFNNSAVNGGGIRNANTATIKNTIIADSPSGGNCSDLPFTAASINNMATDASCGSSFTQVTSAQLNLGTLTAGSPGFYYPLNSGSLAIDAGDNATCAATPVNNESQNGVTRPKDGDNNGTAVCDIGSYEAASSPILVASHSLQSSYSGSGPGFFTVTFNKAADDPAGNSTQDDVTNPTNYLLIEKGANAAADTASCSSGVTGDDVQKTVTSVSYNNGAFTSTVTLAGALSVGSYRLFVCGTTSIVSAVDNTPLNNGVDFTFDFSVQPIPTSLPATGFPRGVVTHLPAQPADKAYASYSDLQLEIPSLKVKAPIVGVLKSDGSWDVSWLGNSVGWLEGSAFPTWSGNTILTAHVWNADNTPGVFAEIKKLKYGDRFIIHASGQTYIYEVRENVQLWGASRVDKVFKHEELDWVTLLTCEGYNPLTDKYLFRRMVRAVLVEVK